MKQIKQIVSMIASETKITLITIVGEILDLKLDGPYDTTKISEFLLPQLSGGNIVEIDMTSYLTFSDALTPEYEDDGIVISHTINGEQIQGIFYPQKVSVQVTEANGETVTIPKVEKLSAQMIRASADQSPSVRNFLKRLAPVVKERLHSAEDLMDFIERTELPLTDNGMIIGYKRVRKTEEEGIYVDCHTRKVTQGVGSIVWMDVDKVDPDRARSCSHGLHVANLDYLSGFGGDATLIVLVDPANFIAVPRGETAKCRVSEYLVVGILSNDLHTTVGRQHISNDETFESLISNTIAGNLPEVNRKVQVGHNGQLIKIETLIASEPVVTESETKRSGKSLRDDPAPEVIKKDIRKMAKQTKATTNGKHLWDSAPSEVIAVFKALLAGKDSKTQIAVQHNTSTRTMGRWCDKYDYEGWVQAQDATLTVSQRARMLFEDAAYDALVAFKKAKKKGWASLGFGAKEIKKIESFAS